LENVPIASVDFLATGNSSDYAGNNYLHERMEPKTETEAVTSMHAEKQNVAPNIDAPALQAERNSDSASLDQKLTANLSDTQEGRRMNQVNDRLTSSSNEGSDEKVIDRVLFFFKDKTFTVYRPT